MEKCASAKMKVMYHQPLYDRLRPPSPVVVVSVPHGDPEPHAYEPYGFLLSSRVPPASNWCYNIIMIIVISYKASDPDRGQAAPPHVWC